MAEDLPAELDGVAVRQNLGEQLPLDLAFVDERGETVRLGDFFVPGRPVVLTLNFFRCESLCNLTLNSVLDTLNRTDWTAGDEYTVVTVSFAPEEGPELASVKKRAYLSRYDRESKSGDSWHFLTGSQESIDALCDAVGFSVRRIERPSPTDDGEVMAYDYAHPPGILFITPDGIVSQYMGDIMYPPEDFRLALVEASEGAIGKPVEKFLLFSCFRYDPDKNSYVVSAIKVMRLAGAVTILAIGAGLLILWARGSRHERPDLALSGVES